MENNVIIKLIQPCETPEALSNHVGRITGLIDAKNFSHLIDVMSINSNPRQPKESSVTNEILRTLERSPERFHFMSKGILVSASSCNILDRSRFRLSFDENEFAHPGILDGGHNTFAIAKYILQSVLSDPEYRSIKNWESLIETWRQNKEDVKSLFTEESIGFGFFIPIEIIYPKNTEDDDLMNKWGDYHRDITHARNNNVQLTSSTQHNHQGYYDYLKDVLPEDLKEKVEWKTNDGGAIKVADIVALSLVLLSKLDPAKLSGVEIDPVKIYNSKQYCIDTFQKVLDPHGYKKGSTFVLTDNVVKSALNLLPKLLEAHDRLYQIFPRIYNASGGAFGRIEGVRMFDVEQALTNRKKYSKKPFSTKYFEYDCTYSYADGFIVPLIIALRELIERSPNGELKWEFDPIEFIENSLNETIKMYSSIIKFSDYNPQKIGKDAGSYEIAKAVVTTAKFSQ